MSPVRSRARWNGLKSGLHSGFGNRLCRALFACWIGICTTQGTLAAPVKPEPSAIGATTALHPQDGPHVDLRFRLEADAFVASLSMNLVFLDWMIEVPREDAERIDPVELATLGPRLEAYFGAQMPVEVDGVRVAPLLRDLSLNDPDPVLLPLFPISGWRGLRKVEFALVYPVKSPPESVSVVWPAYPPDLLSVLPSKPPLQIATEWTMDGLRSHCTFTRSEPGFTWRRPTGGVEARLERVPAPPALQQLVPAWATLAVALFAVGFASAAVARRTPRVAMGFGLLGAAVVLVLRPTGPAFFAFGTRAPEAIPEADAIATFKALHVNLYRAFDYESESAVYDALARSVSGVLLEETYLGVRRALVMEEEGGAMSRVVAVRPLGTRVETQGEITLEDGVRARAFTVETTWQVDGRVTHWGHAHDRTNEYDGRFTVAAESAGWRIHDAEVTRQERVETDAATQPLRPEDEEL